MESSYISALFISWSQNTNQIQVTQQKTGILVQCPLSMIETEDYGLYVSIWWRKCRSVEYALQISVKVKKVQVCRIRSTDISQGGESAGL